MISILQTGLQVTYHYNDKQGQMIFVLAGIQDFLGPMWLEERVIKIISFCDISLKTIFYQTFSFKY